MGACGVGWLWNQRNLILTHGVIFQGHAVRWLRNQPDRIMMICARPQEVAGHCQNETPNFRTGAQGYIDHHAGKPWQGGG